MSVTHDSPTLSSAQGRYLALVRGTRIGVAAAVARFSLWLASHIYRLVITLRNWFYDCGFLAQQRVGIPVVCVGNLTTGGTGKTPCVEFVARFYRERDQRVAILSRGYGQVGGHNDEALVLEENLPDVPHLQGADRVALAQAAVEELESEVLVLDDGFQHRRLWRNLDLVLIDALEPWGYGHVLPRGLLREPRGGLRRADLIVLTRIDQAEPARLKHLRGEIRRLAPRVPTIETTHGPVALSNGDISAPLSDIQGKPVAAFCGIGNPEAFRRTLADLGAQITSFRTFPDHHAYSRADVNDLERWARQLTADGLVVTTQKDLVKLRIATLGERRLWALRVNLRIVLGLDLLQKKLLAAVPEALAITRE